MTQLPNQLPVPQHPEEANYRAIASPVEDFAVPLTHYLWVLRRNLWRIGGFVFVVVTAVLLYSLQLTPIYESAAMLEIENQTPMFRIGDGGFSFDNRSFDTVVATQLEVLDSSEIAAQVVRELRLDQHPDFNPAARKAPAAGRQAAPERRPEPASLPGLTVRRRDETYLLEVGYRSPNPELAAAVANAAARAFVQHGFLAQYRNTAELSKWLNKQLEELKAKLERSQQALRSFEKENKVVNPEDRSNLMNIKLQALLEELTRAQTERLQKQSAYQSVEAGDLESLAISDQGEPLRRLGDRLEQAETDLAEAAAQYGPNHPTYKRLSNQLQRTKTLLETSKQRVLARLGADYKQAQARENSLSAAVTEQRNELDRLSAAASDYNFLKREVESQTKLYEELLKKVNEASINASIRATNLRLVGLASPPGEPVSPKISVNVLLAFLIATTIAIGAALTADYLDRTLRSSEQVEQWLSLPVLASLPRVQGKRAPSELLGLGGSAPARALVQSSKPLNETLTMLRTSVLLASPAADLRLLLVASAAPAEGKSTVASGLALALAQQLESPSRVLLVDSDLRRPSVHSIFGLPNRVGLSTVLEGQSDLEASILPSGAAENLLVLPAGPSPRFASELLTMHMAKILENLRQEFRYVVIDSAPLLVCADTTILSTLADGVLLVARAGETPRDAVSAALRQLRRARASVLGLVLNQVRPSFQPGYGSYYGSYYRSEEA